MIPEEATNTGATSQKYTLGLKSFRLMSLYLALQQNLDFFQHTSQRSENVFLPLSRCLMIGRHYALKLRISGRSSISKVIRSVATAIQTIPTYGSQQHPRSPRRMRGKPHVGDQCTSFAKTDLVVKSVTKFWKDLRMFQLMLRIHLSQKFCNKDQNQLNLLLRPLTH
jgi:hypothetical protein